MSTARTTAALGCLALAGLAGPVAHAQDGERGWYAGAGVGRAASTVDDDRIREGLLNQNLDPVSLVEDEREAAYRLFVGHQYNRHLGVEAGWFDLGRFGYTATTVPAGTLSANVRMRGLHLDAVGSYPLSDRFSLLGRVGVLYAQSRGSFGATGAVTNPYGMTGNSDWGWGFKVGAGVGWQLTPAWQVRLEAERYRIKDAAGNHGNVDVASISLVYRFGASGASRAATGTPPPSTPSTPSIAAAPATPTPGAASGTPPSSSGTATPSAGAASRPAAAAPTTMVQFSADALFDFDKATLRPEGRKQLDAFVQRLRGVRVEGVLVTGHADRIGSKAYNQKLSERRAAAVEAYLVQAGVAQATIRSRGVGEEQPVTTPNDCKANLAHAALVVCLQPDRRVEVEATGTR